MSATLTERVLPELESWSAGGYRESPLETFPALHVQRRDISFYNVSDSQVRIVVTVRNGSRQPSAATEMSIQAAPFGAFVPWSPLTTIPVPNLEPGAAVDLQTDVPVATTRPLGDFSHVPPSRLLTAVSPGDESGQSADKTVANSRPGFPGDLLRLVGQGSVHWAGNLNIFLGGRAVERHRAMALRIWPGRTNLAMFVVGSGRDAYRFELTGSGTAWDPQLFDMSGALSLRDVGERNPPVSDGAWLPVDSQRLMMLAVAPPQECDHGELNVHVTQRSSGQTAVVEFGFDPAAEGPGCYTL